MTRLIAAASIWFHRRLCLAPTTAFHRTRTILTQAHHKELSQCTTITTRTRPHIITTFPKQHWSPTTFSRTSSKTKRFRKAVDIITLEIPAILVWDISFRSAAKTETMKMRMSIWTLTTSPVPAAIQTAFPSKDAQDITRSITTSISIRTRSVRPGLDRNHTPQPRKCKARTPNATTRNM